MKFTIELIDGQTIVQQSIRIKLRLHNDGTARQIPLDYDSSDVVTYCLFGKNGELLASSNAYTQTTRLGMRAERMRQESMKTGKLDRGQDMEWQEDLLSYLEVDAPGAYYVGAKFDFQPGGIHLESNKAPLLVKANRAQWLDTLRDQVSMGMGYFLEQAEEGQTLYHITNATKPDYFWKNGILNIPAGSNPRVSEADFVTTKSFDHDFFRWVIWLRDRALFLTSFSGPETAGQIYRQQLNLKVPELLGHPVQHANRSVSVLLLERENEARSRILRLVFTGTGKLSKTVQVVSLSAKPAPVSSCADWQGTIFIALGTDGRLPLRMIVLDPAGQAVESPLLDEKHFPEPRTGPLGAHEVRILSAQPNVKAYAGSIRAIVGSLLMSKAQSRELEFFSVPLGRDGKVNGAARSVRVALPDGLLAKEEQIVDGDAVEASQDRFTGLITTNLGRIMAIRPGQAPEQVASIRTNLVGLARLMSTPKGAVYAFFPSDQQGIGCARIQPDQSP